MSDRTLDLLQDLMRLMKRYGPAEFDRLAATLSDPTFVESLRTVLASMASATPKRPERSEKEHAEAAIDPNLELLRKRLGDPHAYPHLRDLMDEAQRLGVRVPPSGFKSRKDAVGAIVRHFRPLPAKDLAAAVAKLHVGGRSGSLQEWSEIIMARRR